MSKKVRDRLVVGLTVVALILWAWFCAIGIGAQPMPGGSTAPSEPPPGFSRQAGVVDGDISLVMYKDSRSGYCIVVVTTPGGPYERPTPAVTSFPCHRAQ
jgi:hypothetical protein